MPGTRQPDFGARPYWHSRLYVLPNPPLRSMIDIPRGLVDEKRFIPSPFLTDIEAGELGYDQPTRRIEARFIPAAQLHPTHLDAQLTVPSAAYTHTRLPVLLSISGYSSQPQAGSGSPFSTQKFDSASEEDHSSEDHYIEETSQRVHSLLVQLERHPDTGPNFNDSKEGSVLYALGGDVHPVYDHH
jgi:hypothetical protein